MQEAQGSAVEISNTEIMTPTIKDQMIDTLAIFEGLTACEVEKLPPDIRNSLRWQMSSMVTNQGRKEYAFDFQSEEMGKLSAMGIPVEIVSGIDCFNEIRLVLVARKEVAR